MTPDPLSEFYAPPHRRVFERIVQTLGFVCAVATILATILAAIVIFFGGVTGYWVMQ